MIKVIYERNINSVTVEGHANGGAHGHDLVCASASILIYTIAAFANNTKKAKQSHKLQVRLKEGDSLVSVKPKRRYKTAITLVFDSICGGFELLAKTFPENISYEIKL
jgi:uncharacterized protein YsxB (DUF464 family)